MNNRRIPWFILTIVLFMLCSVASADLTVSESAAHKEISTEQVSRNVLETAEPESNDSSAFLFTNSVAEAYVGDTISVSYEKTRDDITIVSSMWVDSGNDGASGSPIDLAGSSSGTISHTVESGTQCWLEITYRDLNGNYYLAKSEPIKINNYDIEVTLTGVNDNNQIEAGDTLSLEYEVSGGRDDFSVHMHWYLDMGGVFYVSTEDIISDRRTGSMSITPQGEVQHISYVILLYYNDMIVVQATPQTSIQVQNYDAFHDHSTDFVFTNSTNEAYAGDTVSVSYEKTRDDITIVSSMWVDSGNDGASGSPIDLAGSSSGTISHTVESGTQCWLEITYRDLNGNYYLAKSDPINISNYDITVTLTGMNDNNQIEAGDTLSLEYKVSGGRDDFSVHMHWYLDMGGMFYTSTEDIISDRRTGSMSITPQGEVQHISYAILLYYNDMIVVQATPQTQIEVLNSHSWKDPEYEWSEDNTYVTATRVCNNNPAHIQTEKGSVERLVITAPTQNEPGVGVFRAAFTCKAFYTQEKKIVIPALKDMDLLKLPSSLTRIETEAFYDIAAEAIIIPANCTAIEAKAFSNCRNLLYVSLPAGATISENAFTGCPNVLFEHRQ